MTDKPILYMPAMVRALIDRRKWQTRRVLKPQHLNNYSSTGRVVDYNGNGRLGLEFVHNERGLWDATTNPSGLSAWVVPFSYAPGDRLWVKERWARVAVPGNIDPGEVVYAVEDTRYDYGGPWRSPLFMPRGASRLTCVVTDVRAQRIQDISEEDARAEGCPYPPEWAGRYVDRDETARAWFKSLWNQINGAPSPRYGPRDAEGRKVISHYESYPWAAGTRVETHRGKPHYIWGNPWVAAYGFDMHPCNIDRMEVVA